MTLRVLSLRPLGPARLSQLPIYPSDLISSAVEPALGVPMPSTVLGLLGAAAGVWIDKDAAEKDPLLGIGALVERLLEIGFRLVAGSIIAGPILEVELAGETVYSFSVYSKGGTLFVRLDALDEVLDSGVIREEHVVARAKTMTLEGISLNDYGPGSSGERVARPGYHFRRAFTVLVNAEGRPIKFSYHFIVNVPEGLNIEGLVRLGGESRYATLHLHDDERLLKLSGSLASPCVDGLERGRYITLSPWPLLPASPNVLWLSEGGLQPLPTGESSVLGVASLAGFRVRIVRLGLGFSEVARRRRPQLLALPSGTVVELANPLTCDYLAGTLNRAGYYTLLGPAAR